MRYSQMFERVERTTNTTGSMGESLLRQAGYVIPASSGLSDYTCLGSRTLDRIEGVVRQGVDTMAENVRLPSLAPMDFWKRTNRIDTMDNLLQVSPANNLPRNTNRRFILSPTSEETAVDLLGRYIHSYRDLPRCIYQVGPKFRNEPRPVNGTERQIEFSMMDAYSFHTDETDLMHFYGNMMHVFGNIFQKLGIGEDTVIAEASGGAFTQSRSHEFQAVFPHGSDTLYFNKETQTWENKEIIDTTAGGKPHRKYTDQVRGTEVGNIFPLGDRFSKALGLNYTASDGRQYPVQMGCYGIGVSRLLGVIAEKYHDVNGLTWPKQIAPFLVHLVGLNLERPEVAQSAESVHQTLVEMGIPVLYDDRIDINAGDKLKDADSIGVPTRVVVSPKTVRGNFIEVKPRTENQVINVTDYEKLLDIAR